MLEVLQQAPAADVAQGFVSMLGDHVAPALDTSECGLADQALDWVPEAPLHSMLPTNWGYDHQVQAVSTAWADLLNFDQQLASTYSAWTNAEWLQLIQTNLLT